MKRKRYGKSSFTALLLASALSACSSSAYADRPGYPGGMAVAPERQAAPYGLELIGEDGSSLSTYWCRGRLYVLGEPGQRYSIRVTNPTNRRIEALVSVDGLDVIDGRPADFVRKRGYIIGAYGELRVDGFRVSTEEVATFRFSSVRESYAGRKGLPRNVGVIGLAVFEERVYQPPPPVYVPNDYEDRGEPGAYGGRASGAEAKSDSAADNRPAAKAPSAGQAAPAAPSGAPQTGRSAMPTPRERPGLGTEFGERRGSRVGFTTFERATAARPSLLTELRYNDAAGLEALGIVVTPRWDERDRELRETANPFPASGFAEPPRGW